LDAGLTASSYEDALDLLRERLGPEDLLRVVGHVEGIDISTLDPGHVLPNMGVVCNRGFGSLLLDPIHCSEADRGDSPQRVDTGLRAPGASTTGSVRSTAGSNGYEMIALKQSVPGCATL